jgi:hypothetical protein
MTRPNSRIKKKHYRLVVKRRRVEHGQRVTYILTLECGHVVSLDRFRGGKTTHTHCEKCALGLVKA